MTILNTASDGYFNVLVVLHRTIALNGAMGKDKLLNLCSAGLDSAGKIDSDGKRLRETLLRWTQLGLFEESDDGKVSLEKAYQNPDRLRSICRQLLFSESNNQNFWDSGQSIAADFNRGLAFVLAQNIYDNEFTTHTQIQSLEQQQVPDTNRTVLQNDVRWGGLRSWGQYLGFFWIDQRLWPDPTAAVQDELLPVFGKEKELSASEFVVRLGEQLPVLDGGRYRELIEASLDDATWQRPSRPNLLSTSLSRALWRLSRPGGVLRLEGRADSVESRTLQRSGGRDWLNFTHVSLVGKI